MPGIFKSLGQRFRLTRNKEVGLPVYLSEDGERIGFVKGVTRDAKGEITSYQIDCGGTSVEVPPAHLLIREDGVIIEPLWYIEAEKFIRELEIEMMKIPDSDLILTSAENSGIPRTSIIKMISARKDISPLIEKGSIVQKALLDRLQMLEEERSKITQDIITLEQKRIFDEIDRREFITGLIELRKRRVLNEANIEKCRSLLSRLNKLPCIPSEVDLALISSKDSKSIISEEKAGGMMNPEMSQDRIKKIRKVRVLKVEKELEDLKKRLETGLPAGAGGLETLEERVRLTLSIEIKREKIKEINEEIRMLDKALSSPDITGGIKQYLAEKRATLEVQKKKLSEEIKASSRRIEEVTGSSPILDKQEKEIEKSEEEVKQVRDGGRYPVGRGSMEFCVICGDTLLPDLQECPSCGARTLKGLQKERITPKRRYKCSKGITLMGTGIGIIVAAILLYLLM